MDRKTIRTDRVGSVAKIVVKPYCFNGNLAAQQDRRIAATETFCLQQFVT